MLKNPFSFLFESDIFPHARTLRTSLWQKFKDSFFVVYGDMSVTEADEVDPRLGLFDIFVVPGIIARLHAYIDHRYNVMPNPEIGIGETTLFFVSYIINLIFNTLPRAIFSALAAIAAFIPITLPVYLVAKAVDSLSDDSMDQALELQGETEDMGRVSTITLKEGLEMYNGLDIEDLRCEKKGDTVQLSFSANWEDIKVLKFKLSANPYAVKALFTHNIGGVAEECPGLAQDIAELEDEVGCFRI